MKVAIMTDTNSSITVSEGKELGVFVLPMPVIIDGKNYTEGVDIDNDTFYKLLDGGADISTSMASPADLTDMWDDILAEGYDEIVYIPMSDMLSNSMQVAKGFALDYDGKVQVVNNHCISVSLRTAVLNACKLRDDGASANEILTYLETHAKEQSIYITVNTIKRLVKSGRVTPAAAKIGDILGLKPILQIQCNKLDAFAKARNILKAKSMMIEALKKDIVERFSDVPKDKLTLYAAGSLSDTADRDAWLAEIAAAFPDMTPTYYPLSCSITSHVGTETVGIAICKHI